MGRILCCTRDAHVYSGSCGKGKGYEMIFIYICILKHKFTHKCMLTNRSIYLGIYRHTWLLRTRCSFFKTSQYNFANPSKRYLVNPNILINKIFVQGMFPLDRPKLWLNCTGMYKINVNAHSLCAFKLGYPVKYTILEFQNKYLPGWIYDRVLQV